MVGEEPHMRPQAESLLCRNIPGSTLLLHLQPALLPKCLASQAALCYQCSRESPNALWWPRLLEGSASDPAVQELGLRERQKHTQTLLL